MIHHCCSVSPKERLLGIYTVDIDDKELSPELRALALSVVKPDDG